MPGMQRQRGAKRVREGADYDEFRDQSDEDDFEDPKATQITARKKRAPPASKQNIAAIGNVSLFDVATKYASGIGVAAKEWVKEYQGNRAAATAKLMSFVVQVCGVEFDVTTEAVEEGEVDQLVQQLLRKATQDGLDDHLKAKGGRQFREHLLELIERVVQESYAAGLLFDDYGMDKLTNLIIALNCSVVRVFRLVATLAACQLVSCWIRVQVTLNEARDTAQRQLAAEQKKKQNQAVEERIASFRRTVDTCHQRITYLKDMSSKIFQAVAAHRFRDISEEIRSVVIAGIGQWIHLLPADFLQDQYLKYVAWALSDKDAVVRHAAASSLLLLYSKPANISPLHEFTIRFSTRFLELIHDVDEGVAVKGLELLALLVKSGELRWEGVRDVYRLTMDDSREIRLAAARLVAEILQELGKQQLDQATVQSPASVRKARRKSNDKAGPPSEVEMQLAGLVRMMNMMATQQFDAKTSAEAATQLTGALGHTAEPLAADVVEDLVDGLYERVSVLRDWKSLLDILMKEDSRVEVHGGELASTHLMLILRAAVRRSMQPGGSHGAEGKRRGRPVAATSTDAVRQESTLLLMKALPKLIKKNQADANKLVPLLSLTCELQWEVYSLRNSTKAFDDLLQLLCDMLSKHAGKDLIEEAVRCLSHALRNAPDALQDRAMVVVDKLSALLATNLRKGVKALQNMAASDLCEAVSDVVGGGEEDEVLFSVRTLLLRLHRLTLHCGEPARKKSVGSVINIIMEDLASGCDYGPAIAHLTCMTAFLILMWRVSECTATGLPDDADVDDIGGKRDMLINQLLAVAQNTKYMEVKDCVFRVLTDLVLLLSSYKTEGTSVEALSFSPQDDLLRSVWDLCDEILNREGASSRAHSDLDSDMDAEEEEEEAEETDPVVEAKVNAVAAIGRLLSFKAVPQCSWLGPMLMSHYVMHGHRVAQQMKEVCKLLKKTDPDHMPELYVGAIKGAYDRYKVLGGDIESDVMPLCNKISQGFVGFSNSHAQVLRICSSLVTEAAAKPLQDAMEMLVCVEPFVIRLAGQHAVSLGKQLNQAFSNYSPDQSDDAWQPYFDLLDGLADRGDKGGRPVGRSALKGARTHKAPRHITFEQTTAPAQLREEQVARARQHTSHTTSASEGAGGSGLTDGIGVSQGTGHTQGSERSAEDDPIQEAEEEEEEDDSQADGGPASLEQLPLFTTQHPGSGTSQPTSSQRCGAQDGMGVMGTEEQLPVNSVGAKRDREEEEEEEDLEGGDEEDALEPPPRARRRRRV